MNVVRRALFKARDDFIGLGREGGEREAGEEGVMRK